MVGSRDLPPSTTPFFPSVFIRNQFRTKMQTLPKSTDLSGNVAIITGGNAGLGFEVARQLLSFKLSHLILAVRSAERGNAAATELKSQYPAANIEVWLLDMASYDSIQTFAARVKLDLTRLDIAILNAGLFNFKYKAVPSTGREEDIQINYVSTALLALLLLPSLKEKSPAGIPGRLSIINSGLALTAKFATRDQRPLLASFDNPKRFDMNESYGCSKLLIQMFLWKLVDYVGADDVIVNLPDPGYTKGTGLGGDAPGAVRAMASVFAGFAGHSVEFGASTFVDAVVSKGKESHGTFIMSYKIHPFNSQLYTSEGNAAIDALWKETLEEISFANPAAVLEGLK